MFLNDLLKFQFLEHHRGKKKKSPAPKFEFILNPQLPKITKSIADFITPLVNNKEEVLNAATLHKILIDGTNPPPEKIENVVSEIKKKNQLPSSLCRKILKSKDTGYKCLDCEKDSTCIICKECFENGDHKNHRAFIQHGCSGMCDCGDPMAWSEEGFCKNHKGFITQSTIEKFQYNANFKTNITITLQSFIYLISYLCEEVVMRRDTYETNMLEDSIVNISIKGIDNFISFCEQHTVLSYLVQDALISKLHKDFKLRHDCSILSSEPFKHKFKNCCCSPLDLLLRFSLVLGKEVTKKVSEFLIGFFVFSNFKYCLSEAYIKNYQFYFYFGQSIDTIIISNITELEVQLFTNHEFAVHIMKSKYFANFFEVGQRYADLIQELAESEEYGKIVDQNMLDFYLKLGIFLKYSLCFRFEAATHFVEDTSILNNFISMLYKMENMLLISIPNKKLTHQDRFSKMVFYLINSQIYQSDVIDDFIHVLNAIRSKEQRQKCLKKILHFLILFLQQKMRDEEIVDKNGWTLWHPIHQLFVLAFVSLLSLHHDQEKKDVLLIRTPDSEEIYKLLKELECESPKNFMGELLSQSIRAHSFYNQINKRIAYFDPSLDDIATGYQQNFYIYEITLMQLCCAVVDIKDNFSHIIIGSYFQSTNKESVLVNLISELNDNSIEFVKNIQNSALAKEVSFFRSFLELLLIIVSDQHSIFAVINRLCKDINVSNYFESFSSIIIPTVSNLLYIQGPQQLKSLREKLNLIWKVKDKCIQLIEPCSIFDQQHSVFKIKSENDPINFYDPYIFLCNKKLYSAFSEACSSHPTILKNSKISFIGCLKQKQNKHIIQLSIIKKLCESEDLLKIMFNFLQCMLKLEKFTEFNRLGLKILIEMNESIKFGLTSKLTQQYQIIIEEILASKTDECREVGIELQQIFDKISGKEKKESEECALPNVGSQIKQDLKSAALKRQEELKKKFQSKLQNSENLILKKINSTDSEFSMQISFSSSLNENSINCVFCLNDILAGKEPCLYFGYVQVSKTYYDYMKQHYNTIIKDHVNEEEERSLLKKAIKESKMNHPQNALFFSSCSHVCHKNCFQTLMKKNKKSQHLNNSEFQCPQCRATSNITIDTEKKPTLNPFERTQQIQKETFQAMVEKFGKAIEDHNKIFVEEMQIEMSKNDQNTEFTQPVLISNHEEHKMEVQFSEESYSDESEELDFSPDTEQNIFNEEGQTRSNAVVNTNSNVSSSTEFLNNVLISLMVTRSKFVPFKNSMLLEIYNSCLNIINMIDIFGFKHFLQKNLTLYQHILQMLLSNSSENIKNEKKFFDYIKFIFTSNIKNMNSDPSQLLSLDIDNIFISTFFTILLLYQSSEEAITINHAILQHCFNLKVIQIRMIFYKEGLCGNKIFEEKIEEYSCFLLPFLRKALSCFLLMEAQPSNIISSAKSISSNSLLEDYEETQLLLQFLKISINKSENISVFQYSHLPPEALRLKFPHNYHLIKLPEDFKEFSSCYVYKNCDICNQTPVNPLMICLICGKLMCQVTCKRINSYLTIKEKYGNCNIHAKKSHAGIAVFLSAKETKLMIIGEKRNFICNEIYTDKYGQSINDVKTKNADLGSFKLNKNYLQKFYQMYIHHKIIQEIVNLIVQKNVQFRTIFQKKINHSC